MRFKTSKQVAEEIGLSHSQVKARLRQGKIPGIKVAGDWLIPEEPLPEGKKVFGTVKRAVKKLGLSESHLRRLIRDGKIKAEKIGRVWVFTDINQDPIRRRRPKGARKARKEKKD